MTKKDKLAHVTFVYEQITSSGVRQLEEHAKLLSTAVDTWLACMDDDDMDVVHAADECLSKTIKSLFETHLARFQNDLCKYLRRSVVVSSVASSGAATGRPVGERSLRSSLARFAELCHLVKPAKGRAYVELLLRDNTLGKIVSRGDESLQNTLVAVVNKICGAFGWCMTHNETNVSCIIQIINV